MFEHVEAAATAVKLSGPSRPSAARDEAYQAGVIAYASKLLPAILGGEWMEARRYL